MEAGTSTDGVAPSVYSFRIVVTVFDCGDSFFHRIASAISVFYELIWSGVYIIGMYIINHAFPRIEFADSMMLWIEQSPYFIIPFCADSGCYIRLMHVIFDRSPF